LTEPTTETIPDNGQTTTHEIPGAVPPAADPTIKTFAYVTHHISGKFAAAWKRAAPQRICRNCVHWRQEPGQAHQGSCWAKPPTLASFMVPTITEQPVTDPEGKPVVNEAGQPLMQQIQGQPQIVNNVAAPATTAEQSCGDWRRWRGVFGMFGRAI